MHRVLAIIGRGVRMAFRMIHTADWQIGKPFGNIPGDAGAELRLQRIRTVERIAALARDRAVDAVLVAGDVFDSNEVSEKTIVKTLEALREFPGAWVFLPGNHDAALAHSVWTRRCAIGVPENVLIADRPVPLACWGERAVVLPAPLTRRREAHDQTEWFDSAATPEGAIRIGLAHGSVAGRLPGSAEANNEIPAERADRARLDYLALGDWHGQLRIAPRTWYSGTHEPDRHRANKPGLVNLVEIAGPGAPEQVESLAVGYYRWTRRELELVDGTCGEALAALEEFVDEPRRYVVSLEIAGAISFAERHRLQTGLKSWEARLHHLDVDDNALADDPTADDLDAIDTAGFVRQAVSRLQAKAEDANDPDADTAAMALRMMFLHHRERH
jgi:DNA repair exonuclease SbcCD nuclease subunit